MSPGCGCGSQLDLMTQTGGGCGCSLWKGGRSRDTRKNRRGGYRATAKNRASLRKWKQGKSIGFTMRSSLKAKGLIPRASGKIFVSPKYK